MIQWISLNKKRHTPANHTCDMDGEYMRPLKLYGASTQIIIVLTFTGCFFFIIIVVHVCKCDEVALKLLFFHYTSLCVASLSLCFCWCSVWRMRGNKLFLEIIINSVLLLLFIFCLVLVFIWRCCISIWISSADTYIVTHLSISLFLICVVRVYRKYYERNSVWLLW